MLYHLLLITYYLLCLDWDGVRNFVSVMPSTIKRLVLVSSVGVTKYNEIPWRYYFITLMKYFGILQLNLSSMLSKANVSCISYLILKFHFSPEFHNQLIDANLFL